MNAKLQPVDPPGAPLTAVEEKLLAIACKVANLEPAEVLSELESAECLGYSWLWVLYRPTDPRDIWEGLSLEAKLLAYCLAAGRESEANPLDG